MTGEIEAAGDAITGGLIASAIDRGGDGHNAHGGICLNCGTALTSAYCHACGQSGHIHRSIGAIWHDLAHGVLHFEGKIWKTLPLLIFKPGELTRRYVAGERARFVSPLALFLFSVFLMFATLSIFGSHLEAPGMDGDASTELVTGLKFQRGELSAELAEIDRKIAAARAAGKNTGDLRRERANASGLLRILEGGPTVLAEKVENREVVDAHLKQKRDAAAAELKGVKGKIDAAQAAGQDTKALKARRETLRSEIEQLRDAANAIERKDKWTFANIKTGWARLDKGIAKANENPNLLLYKLQTNAYKYSWMLIPISVPFVWLLFFWQRRWHMYDHSVFVTYSLSFMTLFFTALTVAAMAGLQENTVEALGVFLPPVHMYFQLKGAYQQTRAKALVRTTLLLFFTVFA
ncbi:MAG: DUF3667 domain-containing protein, partial [Sphingomonadaceae bacterium]